jgi:hypothetical protein
LGDGAPHHVERALERGADVGDRPAAVGALGGEGDGGEGRALRLGVAHGFL